jgi:LysR family transcriptional regulator, nitrogen assimilation regulatory protein
MDLKQLEYFVRVAELGSFTRAAQLLQVAQPALSRQVRLLEVELRQTLLIRNGRGALPTEAGALLLRHGRGILHQVERAKEELGRVRGALAGRVALGLPPSLIRLCAVPLVHAFREQLPQAHLSVTEGLSAAMQEWLQAGRIDVALIYNAQVVSDIDVQPLLDEELFVVRSRAGKAQGAAPLAPLPLRDLAKLPLIIPTRPNAVRKHVESALANLGLKPQIALEIDGVAAILNLVAEGMGAAVLSKQAIAGSAMPQAFELQAITPSLQTRLSIATSSQRPVTLTQQACIEVIKAVVLQHMAPQAAHTPVA